MKAKFNLEKEARKALVKALGEVTGKAPVYQGAPGFAFAVGGIMVDRCGTVDFGTADRDTVTGLLTELAAAGFVFEGELEGVESDAHEQETSPDATAPAYNDDGDSVRASDVNPDEDSTLGPLSDESSETHAEKPDSGPGLLSIDVPLSGFTASALDNLERLVEAKAWIIRKMTGAEELPIVRQPDRLCFPWFRPESSAAEIDAYSRLIAGLCETAKKKQRVTAKERRLENGDNEKFKARCFLLSLGFIGDDSKTARKILLAPMSGNGSHRTGEGKKVAPPHMPVAVSRESNAEQGVPKRCGECWHHLYYTDGLMRTKAGGVVDTSSRETHTYTHYCLNTPRGFRKLKSACDWNGMETPPKWCPLKSAADIASGEEDTDAVTVH
jgi:hypothetical protein